MHNFLTPSYWLLPLLSLCHYTTGQFDLENFCDDQDGANETSSTILFDPPLESAESPKFGTVFQCANKTLISTGCWARQEDPPFDTLNVRGYNPARNVKILADGETLIYAHFLMQCQNVTGNGMKMVKIGCYVDNRILAPGQNYIDGSEYYACQALDHSEAIVSARKNGVEPTNDQTRILDIVFEKAGCVSMYGQRTKLNEFDDIGDFRHVCSADATTGKFHLKADACLVDDVAYRANDLIVVADYWFACRRSGDHLTVKPGGCVVDGFLVNIGELFHSSGFVGRCELVKNQLPIGGDKIRRSFWGCLGKSGNGSTVAEYPVGASWLEGSSDSQLKYEITCTKSNDHEGIKMTSRCALQDPRKSDTKQALYLRPNHFTRIGKILWICRRTAYNQLASTITKTAGMRHTVEAIMEGLLFS